ncbi:AI-2E family transporter [Geminicoccus sp.]|uniref:AI-2E family transporter n=1 Tax=Geminicoccus sp. TaxID=2024832 RepID=UPI0039C8A1E0
MHSAIILMATVVVGAAVIGALYFGRAILIPVALAVLLSFALAPMAVRLKRWGLSRIPAVLLVVLVAFAGIAAFGVLVGSQLVQLADNLPQYQNNIAAKIRSFQDAAPQGGVLDHATTMLRELGAELHPTVEDRPAGEPVTVRVEEPPTTTLEVLQSIGLPLLAPVGTAGIVIVLVVFMLIEREDLRDRLIGLFGGDLQQTIQAMNDVAQRVSRFLLMQLLVNATYGIPIGLGLWLIGVPNALLWGVLATVLRFVPYVGPFVAALFPIALAVAVDPGWSMLFWTLGLILTVELISNSVLEPWLYGASTGVSTVAILVAAVFWTALWGPVGLLLSTPLTVCLAVVARYVPHLRFLDVMLGSQPVLSPSERLYQRMLAGDAHEGEDMSAAILETQPLATFYDEVGLPALRLAEADRSRERLFGESRALVTEGFVTLVADLADHEGPDVEEADSSARMEPIIWVGKPVACIAGRTGLDRAAACMLAQLLERRGIGSQVLPADAISPEGIANIDLKDVELVCLSYLNRSAVAQARQACRRLRRKAPDIKIMVGLWNGQLDEAKTDDPAAGLMADLVACSLTSALTRIEALATTPLSCPTMAAPAAADEDVRLAALNETGLLDTPPEERFDRITRKLAKAFDVPICLVSLVDEHRQFWKSSTGLPPDLASARQAAREMSICSHVVAANEVIVVEDVLRDKRFANNPWLKERGIRFYAGAPLRTDNGSAIGSLCLIDTVPRSISTRDKAVLQLVADEVMVEVRRGSAPDLAEAPKSPETLVLPMQATVGP